MAIRSQPPQEFAREPQQPSETALRLAELRERRAILELEREQIDLAGAEKRLLESQARIKEISAVFEDTPYPQPADGVDYERAARSRNLFEAYGAYDYLDIIGPGGAASTWGQPLGYGMQSYLNPLSTRVDRAQGRDRPFVITEIDLGFIRGVARIVCEINCPAKGAIRNLVNYTVGGKGFQYAVATKKPGQKTPDGLIAAVQEVVDEFLERVKWCGALGKEGELVRRWFRDGEYFLQAHCDRVGRTDVRMVEPEQITEQGAQEWTAQAMAEYGIDVGQADIDTTFGVLTPKHDVNTRWAYNAWFDDLGSSDLLPADSLQHFKLSDTNIKRGISDFYGAVKWLQRSDSLLTKTAGGAAIQAAIAGIRKHAAGVTKDDVSAFRASKTDYTTTAYMPGGSARTFNNYSYPDGTILDIPFGLDWDQPPAGADRGPAFVEVAQSLLRWVACQWSMPEFMISSDASNANFSSTLVSEAPFVKNIQGLQFGFGSMWHDLIWRVIYNAARYGRFDRFGEDGSYYALKSLLKLHVSYPTIETRDRNQETERLKTLCDDGIISPKKRAAEEGYDYAEEQAQGAKQRPAEITAKADGMDSSGGITSLAGPDAKGGKPGEPPKPEQPGDQAPDEDGEGPDRPQGPQPPKPAQPGAAQQQPAAHQATGKPTHESAPLFETGAEHAPKGGATIGGKKFEGGQFIPAKDMAKATPAEKHALKAKQEADKAEHARKTEAGEKPAGRGEKFQQKLPGMPKVDDRGNKLLFTGAPKHRSAPDVNAIAMKERAAKISSGGESSQPQEKPLPTDLDRRIHREILNELRDPQLSQHRRQYAEKRLQELENEFNFKAFGNGKDEGGNKLLFAGGPIARSHGMPAEDREKYEAAWEQAHSFANSGTGTGPGTENERQAATKTLNELHDKYGDSADALNEMLAARKEGPTSEIEDEYRDLYNDWARNNSTAAQRNRLDELEQTYGDGAFESIRDEIDPQVRREKEGPSEQELDQYRRAWLRYGSASGVVEDLENKYGKDAFSDVREEFDEPPADNRPIADLTPSEEKAATEKAEQDFGDKDSEFYAEISGLTKDVTGNETPLVDVSDIHPWHGKYSDDYPVAAVGQDITISHPYLNDCDEFVGVDKDGKKMLRIGLVVVRRPPAPKGFGAKMFGAQVEAAKAQGLDYITLHAAGDPTRSFNSMNGYYTWPRFGFDQDIDTLQSGALRERVRKQFPKAKTVLDVFASPGGAEWWNDNGGDMHQARFDLHEGSRSLQVWKAYQEAKKQIQAHVGGEASHAV